MTAWFRCARCTALATGWLIGTEKERDDREENHEEGFECRSALGSTLGSLGTSSCMVTPSGVGASRLVHSCPLVGAASNRLREREGEREREREEEIEREREREGE